MKTGFRTIIIDIDGTLNRFAGRFKSYDRANDADNIAILESLEPIQEVVDLVKILQWQRVNIVMATARPIRFQGSTRAQLGAYGIRWDRLYMRMDDDLHDVQVKEDILVRLLADEEIGDCPIWFVLEDRQACVDMWRSKGLVCLQPAPCGYPKVLTEANPGCYPSVTFDYPVTGFDPALPGSDRTVCHSGIDYEGQGR